MRPEARIRSARYLWQRSAGRALCAVLACVCALGVARTARAEDIALGVIAGMTGPGASYGRGIARGAQMAVREINAAGGINGSNIKLVVVDDASNPARSLIAMRRLVEANVDLIVGGWGSAQVLANMDIAEQAGIPYIVVGATHTQITDTRNRWTFRVIPSDASMADRLAHIVVDRLGARRIAVINDANDYGVGSRRAFVAALARAGLAPVEVQSYQTRDKDFTRQLGRIGEARPEVLAVFGTVPAAPLIMREARKLGIDARFVGTGGLANDALISSARSAAEGAVVVSYFNEDADAAARTWAGAYRKEFADQAEPPSPVLAAWEYRAIHGIAAPCLRRVGTDRVRLRDCIAHWHGRLLGLRGAVYFDKTGQLIQEPVVVEIRGGVFRLLGNAN